MPEPATGAESVSGPREWSLKEERGGGPFTTRLAWAVPEGGTAVWASRAARKRARIELRDAEGRCARCCGRRWPLPGGCGG